MKDILKFSQYVGRIVEAHNSGDAERERQLANVAELYFDMHEVPDYDAETGQAVEEPPFEQQINDLCFTPEQREAFIQDKIQHAQEIQANAEKYLRETEGEKAPARRYMELCSDAVRYATEQLKQLADKYEARKMFAEQTNTKAEGPQGIGQSYTINPETGEVDGRESLCIKSNLTVAEKANLFKELCQTNVFDVDNGDSKDRDNALNAFRSFIFGDVVNCNPDYRLTARQGNLSAFLYALNMLGYYKGNRQYETAKLWCTRKEGKELNADSMNTTARKNYVKSTKIQDTIKKYFEKK